MATLGPGEPAAGPWRTVALDDFVHDLRETAGVERPVIAVDGRGASGKTTLAGRLRAAISGAVGVSTDDIAWNYSMFGWGGCAAEGVLRPYREGRAVSFRPPGWDEIGRAGAIVVPVDAPALIFEGVGASRTELVPLIDVAVWVQSDFAVAERLGLARDVASGVNGNEAETVAFWHTWMAEEVPFFEADRPWERADFIVAGNLHEPRLFDGLRIAPPVHGEGAPRPSR